MKRILVTGGAGYIGSVLLPKLLNKKYDVTVIDSLVYGQEGIEKLIKNKLINFIHDDIRNISQLDFITKKIDCVIHLAAVVGQPLCEKIPIAAQQINEFATKKLVDICKKNNVKQFIFSSTCSNYGSTTDLANESSLLNPLGPYSEAKVNSEKYILQNKTDHFHPTVLRFATAYGISPRMRFDLLLSELMRDAVINKKITIFGPQYWRPIVHVKDISDACILALDSDHSLVSGEIFNVGSNDQNYKKIQLAEYIKKFIPETEIEIIENKKDPRNYRVSFDKIMTKLGFSTKVTIDEGISEIIYEVKNNGLDPQNSEFSNMSKLTEKIKPF